MGETTESWPAGATFLFDILIANEAAQGAATIECIYTPGEGNEFEILYGEVVNLDTVARTCDAIIDTGTTGSNLGILNAQSLGAGAGMGYPQAMAATANEFVFPVGPLLISGPMRLRLAVESVADGQDARFRGAFRIKGQPPSRSVVGAGTPVVTATTERVV